jgi:hypothetical protein
MKPSPKKDFDLLQAIADSYPQLAANVARVRHRYETGQYRQQPLRWDQCKSWLDGWLYVYRRCDLDYSQHLAWKDEQAVCAVFYGHEFNDRVVDWLERFQGRFGVDGSLRELRLIETRISPQGIRRLNSVLPAARIATYSSAEADAHPELSHANA